MRIINEPTAAALAYGLDKKGKIKNRCLRFRWRYIWYLCSWIRRRSFWSIVYKWWYSPWWRWFWPWNYWLVSWRI
jgi:hypothetical protein